MIRVTSDDSAILLISEGFLMLKIVNTTDVASKTDDSSDTLASKFQRKFAQLRCD